MLGRHVVSTYTRLLIRPCSRSITTSPIRYLARKKTDEQDAEETKVVTGKKRVHRKSVQVEGDGTEKPVLGGLLEKQAKVEASVRRRASLSRTKEAKAAGIELPAKKRGKAKSEDASPGSPAPNEGTKPPTKRRAKPKSSPEATPEAPAPSEAKPIRKSGAKSKPLEASPESPALEGTKPPAKKRAKSKSEDASPEPPALEGTKPTTRKRAKAKPEDASQKAPALEDANPPTKRRSKPKSTEATPELLVPGSRDHHDLATYLVFAKKNELKTTSTTYKGTLYEYTVADVLKGFGFNLHRTGRANDLGIDLLGHWHLPDGKQQLKVLLQCKAGKIGPPNLRELMGAYVGAPMGWQGDNVLALLVSTRPATKGVIAAVQRSPSPIGVMQVDGEGYVRQFLWNAVAGERGLAGLGVTTRFSEDDAAGISTKKVKKELVGTIVLTWLGEPWRKAPIAPVKALAEAAV
jgi:hypothetical protein